MAYIRMADKVYEVPDYTTGAAKLVGVYTKGAWYAPGMGSDGNLEFDTVDKARSTFFESLPDASKGAP